MLDKFQPKFTCREEGFGKRYHALLHRPKVAPNYQKGTEGNIYSHVLTETSLSL